MNGSLPAVSIVVPCRNEKGHIGTCIRSILGQEPPPGGFEIIVADGMSDDGTLYMLDKLARNNRKINIDNNPDSTTAHRINTVIPQAHSRYIAIMRAHNYYSPDCRSSSF